VDATLSVQAFLHGQYHEDSKTPVSKSQPQGLQDQEEWKAAYHAQFNRRGTYIAVGYASGLVGVHDIQSRTLSAFYRGNYEQTLVSSNSSDNIQTPTKEQRALGNGVTSVSWSRRSRTLLAGAVGDTLVRLYDTTHPHGPEECAVHLMPEDAGGDHHDIDEDKPLNPRPSPSNFVFGDRVVRKSTFADVRSSYVDYANEPLTLSSETVTFTSKPGNRDIPYESSTRKITRYPALHFQLPKAVGGSLEVHPRYTTGGLAVLSDGSLVLFWIPESAWCKEHGSSQQDSTTETVRIWTLWNDISNHTITCAAFDPQGDRMYAATREGHLLGFEVGSIFKILSAPLPREIPACEKQCNFTIRITGGASVWHLVVSRDGKCIITNCADGVLRLYLAKECWEAPEDVDRPVQVFQDVVNKVKFASCAISGDAEYVVGGANGVVDNKYELYIWNLSTGSLMDKLTGAPVHLYSVAWHPTRSFLAVAASDGLVDVWGPRINWTAFAPDFQALPMNVEYVEREDEFDLDKDGNMIVTKEEENAGAADENVIVDVVTVDAVPVFASDSEDEEDVFHFEPKFSNLLSGRLARTSIGSTGQPALDDT